VDLQLAFPCDGILKINFIEKYNCQLDFKPFEDWLIIRPYNLKFSIYVLATTQYVCQQEDSVLILNI